MRHYPYCAKIGGHISFYGLDKNAISKRLQKWWRGFYRNNSKSSYMPGENGIYFWNDATQNYEPCDDIDSSGNSYYS